MAPAALPGSGSVRSGYAHPVQSRQDVQAGGSRGRHRNHQTAVRLCSVAIKVYIGNGMIAHQGSEMRVVVLHYDILTLYDDVYAGPTPVPMPWCRFNTTTPPPCYCSVLFNMFYHLFSIHLSRLVTYNCAA
eukprot:1187074-Prorocentrum_minimum.AAC.6